MIITLLGAAACVMRSSYCLQCNAPSGEFSNCLASIAKILNCKGALLDSYFEGDFTSCLALMSPQMIYGSWTERLESKIESSNA